jgi:hypothetical protein
MAWPLSWMPPATIRSWPMPSCNTPHTGVLFVAYYSALHHIKTLSGIQWDERIRVWYGTEEAVVTYLKIAKKGEIIRWNFCVETPELFCENRNTAYMRHIMRNLSKTFEFWSSITKLRLAYYLFKRMKV